MTQPASVCAYCGKKRATHSDHVVPKSLRKTHPVDYAMTVAFGSPTVPSCHECNWRKGTRRLVPPSWEGNIPALNALFGGTPWRVWTGDVTEEAYRNTYV